ncbi:MAG TPA: class I SAM-dependent methyltransferase [bacterium]|nr:class I SAM-dependent methyltransferase [bacterium]
MENQKDLNRNYWEANIKAFSEFYDNNSEETLLGPKIIRAFYKKFLFPIEKKYMLIRYNIVSGYIDNYVKTNMKVADVGCGCGVYVPQLLSKKVFVYAYDYADASIELVKKKILPHQLNNIEVKNVDISTNSISEVDVVIGIGVLTYIPDYNIFFKNILPYTKRILFNFLDNTHIINILRKKIRLLDIRKYSYHNFDDIKFALTQFDYKIDSINKFATNIMISAVKN